MCNAVKLTWLIGYAVLAIRLPTIVEVGGIIEMRFGRATLITLVELPGMCPTVVCGSFVFIGILLLLNQSFR